ncbi:MAG TPA: sigma 54-interacting transcriptional regulator [Candidatus Acidoferrum sp.]|nr:sigma 54-interacting transcriptional regulator [Candidatus Acidoferrum sp.]
MTRLLDYTTDLSQLAALATEPNGLDQVLGQALRSLHRIVPYDLAALFELSGNELTVRALEGPLASAEVRRHRLSLERFPTIREALHTRRPIALDERDHLGAEGDPYDGLLDLPPGHACMVVPLFSATRDLGLITLDRQECLRYSQEAVELAGVYAQIVSMAMIFAEQSQLLDRYRRLLKEENRLLREEVLGTAEACRRVRASSCPAVRAVAHAAEQVARTSLPVLITGETGTGKEVLASAIHAWSLRSEQPFVTLNCAAIPENLVESELFGYVRGAFSGAVADRPGRFVTANGGTLFLDEIGDMPMAAQSKLLRVLEEGTFEAVGSDRTVRVDVRVIAATHVDLPAAVRERTFREDLYFRIAVFPLRLPPLRERREDIAPLAQQILDDLSSRRGLGPWSLSQAAAAALVAADWPGNVRQLVNTLERASILKQQGMLEPEHLAIGPAPAASAPPVKVNGERFPGYRENERHHLSEALARCGGKIYGAGGAAALLGLRPTTLQSKLRKLGLR